MTQQSKRIETAYSYTLNRLLRSMRDFVGADAQNPQDIIRRLKLYASSSAYQQWCNQIALNVATQVNKGVSATWREASQKAGRGNELHTAILEELRRPSGGAFSEIVRTNAEALKTFPLNISEELTEYISRQSMEGRRGADIMKDLKERFPETAKSRLQLIARTEVSKAQSALTQARAQALGLDWYVWRTSEDSRVRSAHRHMEGVLINWNNPPSPEMFSPDGEQAHYGYYHAGDTFNCRCYAEVVVNLDYVNFPIKVYRNNYIAPMTRAAFEKIS